MSHETLSKEIYKYYNMSILTPRAAVVYTLVSKCVKCYFLRVQRGKPTKNGRPGMEPAKLIEKIPF